MRPVYSYHSRVEGPSHLSVGGLGDNARDGGARGADPP